MLKRFIALLVLMVLLFSCACAEDNVWALCKSYVNLREKPSLKAQIVGYLWCGDGAETDWVIKNGWLHIISPVVESGDSWVKLSYIVDSKPKELNNDVIVVSNGRVAIRKTVDGKRISWAKHGDVLKALWISDEWTLTTKGYIKSEYLELEDLK